MAYTSPLFAMHLRAAQPPDASFGALFFFFWRGGGVGGFMVALKVSIQKRESCMWADRQGSSLCAVCSSQVYHGRLIVIVLRVFVFHASTWDHPTPAAADTTSGHSKNSSWFTTGLIETD